MSQGSAQRAGQARAQRVSLARAQRVSLARAQRVSLARAQRVGGPPRTQDGTRGATESPVRARRRGWGAHRVRKKVPRGTRSAAAAPRGFTGQTITLEQQRALFRRWTTGTDAHPHEALLGILALLHGASSSEVPHLQAGHVDAGSRAVRLGRRLHPVPLDPASWQVLQRCLAHRAGSAPPTRA